MVKTASVALRRRGWLLGGGPREAGSLWLSLQEDVGFAHTHIR